MSEQKIIAMPNVTTPNRPVIFLLGLVLSIGCGAGYAAVAESLDSSVRGPRSVAAALQAAPLSVIPYLQNSDDLARTIKIKRIVIAVFAGSFVALLLLVHFFWTPLDVLWFKGLRKAGDFIGS